MTSSSIPILNSGCGLSCPGGHYLDLGSGSCLMCRAGTASRGDSLLVSKWDRMPVGFEVDVTYASLDEKQKCLTSGWFPRGEYLLGKTAVECATTLSIKIDNLVDGFVSFSYQVVDDSALSYFTVRNQRCAQVPGTGYSLEPTGKTRWNTLRVSLPKGHNILQWYLLAESGFFAYFGGGQMPEMHLRSIEIGGIPPITTCAECPPGTFNPNPGAIECQTCPRNTYSTGGSTMCEACSTEDYAEPGSANCTKRPPCIDSDFMGYWTPCDSTGQTNLQFKWIEPLTCNDQTGVKMTVNQPKIACSSCPVGTMPDQDTSLCRFCRPEERTLKDVQEGCFQCPVDQVPSYGLVYDTWSRRPPWIKTSCVHVLGGNCTAWEFSPNYLAAGVGMEQLAMSQLTLSVPNGFITAQSDDTSWSWFASSRVPLPDTYLFIDFELVCNGPCYFSLAKLLRGREIPIGDWIGQKSRMNFTYQITFSDQVDFIWTFEKSSYLSSWTREKIQDHVKIYKIHLTNAVNSSITGCRTCVKGIENGQCVSCPPGLFYSEVELIPGKFVVNCTQCPNGTVLIADARSTHSVKEACHPCEPGTRAVNHSVCILDKRPPSPGGGNYDLTKLMASPQRITGRNMFTPSGTPFHHAFRLTLGLDSWVECFNNSTESTPSSIRSFICRHTAVRDRTKGTVSYVYTKPLSLADRLERALPSSSSPEFWNEANRNLTRAGWKEDKTGNDFHYFFTARERTVSCPNGRTSSVTLRCGPYFSNTEGSSPQYIEAGGVELPPSCPDGTCDGCHYQFLWTSNQACPICGESNYTRLLGECNYRQRHVYILPADGCRMDDNMQTTIIETCPLLSTQQLFAIILTAIVLVILGFIIYFCHRRNQKLQYKYMKLVQSTENRPPVPTCGLEEGEEDNIDNVGRRSAPSKNSGASGLVLEPSRLVSNPAAETAFSGGGGGARQTAKDVLNKLKPSALGPIVFKSNGEWDQQVLTLDDGNSADSDSRFAV